MKKSLLALFLGLLFVFTSNAQSQWTGKVIQVIDGRTAIVADNSSKITVLLKDIEVPESEQPLSQVVKDHLTKLILNKTVTVSEFSAYSKGVTGTIFLDKIDISKQLLRDGAAWFNYPESRYSGFASDYQSTESLAKSEKRGVWGIANLKPAWEFREEKQKEQIEKDRQTSKQAKPQVAQTANETIWADIPTNKKEESENTSTLFDPNRKLSYEYDAFTDEGAVFAPEMLLQMDTGVRKILSVQYRHNGNKVKNSNGKYFVATTGINYDDEIIFLNGKGQRYNLGRGERTGSQSLVYAFNIDRKSLIAIFNSDTVLVKIGVSRSIIEPAYINAVRRLLIATQ